MLKEGKYEVYAWEDDHVTGFLSMDKCLLHNTLLAFKFIKKTLFGWWCLFFSLYSMKYVTFLRKTAKIGSYCFLIKNIMNREDNSNKKNIINKRREEIKRSFYKGSRFELTSKWARCILFLEIAGFRLQPDHLKRRFYSKYGLVEIFMLGVH